MFPSVIKRQADRVNRGGNKNLLGVLGFASLHFFNQATY